MIQSPHNMRLSDQSFKRLSDIAYRNAGIALKENKKALVIGRISHRMRALQINTTEDYLNYLENDPTGEEIIHFIDVISTNYTHFMRESQHFSYLKTVIEKALQTNESPFHIWSAACSSGEEPYSIVLTIEEILKGRPFNYKVLATDISTRILDKAKLATYPESALKNVSPKMRKLAFKRIEQKSEEKHYQVLERFRKKVTFRRLNLIKPPYPMKGPFKVIFCRNVMIYFEKKERQIIINEFSRLLAPKGDLYIGHAESLNGINHSFETIKPSFYRRPSQ